MSKRARRIDQPELPFTAPAKGGITEEVYVGVRVMETVKRLMRERNVSRENLASFLFGRRGRHVPVTTIDMWFSPDKADRWPGFPTLLLMCEWLQSLEPLNALAEALGGAVIDHRGKTLLKVGQAYLDQRKLEISKGELERAVESYLVEDLRRGR